MATSVRPLSSVARHLVEAYLIDQVGFDRELIAWKYFDSAFNDNRERGFVLLRDDNVAGFLGLIPFELRADGETWQSGWICDWYCAVPGLGGFLLHEAVRSCKHVAAFGAGTAFSRPGLSGFSSAEYTEAGEVHHYPVRFAPVLLKIGSRVPWLALEKWPILKGLPLPAPRRTELTEATRTVAGVPEVIEPLLGGEQNNGYRPNHDLRYVQWQIGRCPYLHSWTCYLPGDPGPPAAVVCWRRSDESDKWRLFPVSRPGASRELSAVLGQALRTIRSDKGTIATVMLSRQDVTTASVLRSCRFVKSRSEVPLFVYVAPDANQPLAELSGLSFLCTDLAYRF